MPNLCRKCFFILVFLFLSGCGERDVPAPVEEIQWHPSSFSKQQYTVKKGDTLYAIAFEFDKDYRQLAALNHIRNPYTLKVGQKIKLKTKKKTTKRNKKISKNIKRIALRTLKKEIHKTQWKWPVKGRIASSFIPRLRKKGINIAGRKGDRIRASADGIVAYAGNGLPGYGNLIILKHSNQYLTAYGHNSRNRVREGQRVKQGQVIADIGRIDRRYWGVHFEIRKTGKPVNPLNYLKKG